MSILKKLLTYVHFEDEKGIIQQQGIEFEWKPTICEKCKKYGHEAEQCKKENGPMEWRPRAIQPRAGITQQPTQQEWIQVGRNQDPQISQEPGHVLSLISNCFEVLQETDIARQDMAMHMSGTLGMGVHPFPMDNITWWSIRGL